jgi:hypothetical protein
MPKTRIRKRASPRKGGRARRLTKARRRSASRGLPAPEPSRFTLPAAPESIAVSDEAALMLQARVSIREEDSEDEMGAYGDYGGES